MNEVDQSGAMAVASIRDGIAASLAEKASNMSDDQFIDRIGHYELSNMVHETRLGWFCKDFMYDTVLATEKMKGIDWSLGMETIFPDGIVIFAETMPPLPGTFDSVVGFMWLTITDQIDVYPIVRHDDVLENGESGPFGFQYYPLTRLTFNADECVNSSAVKSASGGSLLAHQAASRFMEFVGAALVMCKAHDAVYIQELVIPHYGSGAKPTDDHVDKVRVINVRPPKSKVTVGGDLVGRKRNVGYRTVVRGHFRNQRVGKGRLTVKVIYIPPYLKGPAGAPILRSNGILSWDRSKLNL